MTAMKKMTETSDRRAKFDALVQIEFAQQATAGYVDDAVLIEALESIAHHALPDPVVRTLARAVGALRARFEETEVESLREIERILDAAANDNGGNDE